MKSKPRTPRHSRSPRNLLRLAVCLALSVAVGSSARAADLGANCCLDLEERIAELEATAARKGNRTVALTIGGQVNRALLLWDDGTESNAYSVGNKNDQSNFSFAGDAKIAEGVAAGYEIVVRLRDYLSDAANQESASNDPGFDLWQSHWWIESETLGKISVGHASRVTDTAPETDFSEAGVAGYAGVQDVAGGFFLRRADGGLADVAWGDIGNHMNGDTADLIRYDSPSFAGFVASVSWGKDDVWDAGLRYSYEGHGVQFEAVAAYSEITDEGGEGGHVDENVLVGSASILHEASGLNLTVAAGVQEFDALADDPDGVARAPSDARFIYAKLGWLAKLNALGPTAFYAEYGRYEDFLTAGADGGVVASLADVAGGCAVAGDACRVTGSELDVWGLGAVQHIEAAEMQVYLGYRRYGADVDLVDGAGNAAAAARLEDLHTLIAGSKIAF